MDRSDYINSLYKQYERNKNEEEEKENTYREKDDTTKRGLLDRVLSPLQNTSITSALYNITDDDPDTTFLGGIGAGLSRQFNPLKNDVSDTHYTADVLNNVFNNGEEPDTVAGKIATSVGGFVGDIVLDPMSYVTDGVSAVGKILKGTGTVDVAKSSKVLDKVTKASKLIDDVPVNRGVTLADAKKVIKTRFDNAEGLDTVVDALSKKLTDDYNTRIAGAVAEKKIRQGKGLTVGLGNLPFAEKFAKKGKTNRIFETQLVSEENIRKFGDNTVAPYFNRLEQKLRKTKTGQALSKYNKLLAESDDNLIKSLEKFATIQSAEGIKVKGANGFSAVNNIVDNINKMDKVDRNVLNKAWIDGDLDTARTFYGVKKNAVEKAMKSKDLDDLTIKQLKERKLQIERQLETCNSLDIYFEDKLKNAFKSKINKEDFENKVATKDVKYNNENVNSIYKRLSVAKSKFDIEGDYIPYDTRGRNVLEDIDFNSLTKNPKTSLDDITYLTEKSPDLLEEGDVIRSLLNANETDDELVKSFEDFYNSHNLENANSKKIPKGSKIVSKQKEKYKKEYKRIKELINAQNKWGDMLDTLEEGTEEYKKIETKYDKVGEQLEYLVNQTGATISEDGKLVEEFVDNIVDKAPAVDLPIEDKINRIKDKYPEEYNKWIENTKTQYTDRIQNEMIEASDDFIKDFDNSKIDINTRKSAGIVAEDRTIKESEPKISNIKVSYDEVLKMKGELDEDSTKYLREKLNEIDNAYINKFTFDDTIGKYVKGDSYKIFNENNFTPESAYKLYTFVKSNNYGDAYLYLKELSDYSSLDKKAFEGINTRVIRSQTAKNIESKFSNILDEVGLIEVSPTLYRYGLEDIQIYNPLNEFIDDNITTITHSKAMFKNWKQVKNIIKDGKLDEIAPDGNTYRSILEDLSCRMTSNYYKAGDVFNEGFEKQSAFRNKNFIIDNIDDLLPLDDEIDKEFKRASEIKNGIYSREEEVGYDFTKRNNVETKLEKLSKMSEPNKRLLELTPNELKTYDIEKLSSIAKENSLFITDDDTVDTLLEKISAKKQELNDNLTELENINNSNKIKIEKNKALNEANKKLIHNELLNSDNPSAINKDDLIKLAQENDVDVSGITSNEDIILRLQNKKREIIKNYSSPNNAEISETFGQQERKIFEENKYKRPNSQGRYNTYYSDNAGGIDGMKNIDSYVTDPDINKWLHSNSTSIKELATNYKLDLQNALDNCKESGMSANLRHQIEAIDSARDLDDLVDTPFFDKVIKLYDLLNEDRFFSVASRYPDKSIYELLQIASKEGNFGIEDIKKLKEGAKKLDNVKYYDEDFVIPEEKVKIDKNRSKELRERFDKRQEENFYKWKEEKRLEWEKGDKPTDGIRYPEIGDFYDAPKRDNIVSNNSDKDLVKEELLKTQAKKIKSKIANLGFDDNNKELKKYASLSFEDMLHIFNRAEYINKKNYFENLDKMSAEDLLKKFNNPRINKSELSAYDEYVTKKLILGDEKVKDIVSKEQINATRTRLKNTSDILNKELEKINGISEKDIIESSISYKSDLLSDLQIEKTIAQPIEKYKRIMNSLDSYGDFESDYNKSLKDIRASLGSVGKLNNQESFDKLITALPKTRTAEANNFLNKFSGDTKELFKETKGKSINELNRIMKERTGVDKFFEDDIADMFLGFSITTGQRVQRSATMNMALRNFATTYNGKSVDEGEAVIVKTAALKKYIKEFQEAKGNIKLQNPDLSVLEGMNLDVNGVKYNAMFTKLDPETYKKISEDFMIKDGRVVNSLSAWKMKIDDVDKFNQAAHYQNMESENAFWKVFDKIQSVWKTSNTVVNPGFHVNNAIGGVANTFLYCGESAFDVNKIKTARTILTNPDPKQFVNINGKKYTYKQLNYILKQSGVVDNNYFAKDFEKTSYVALPVIKQGFQLGNEIESTQRATLFIEALRHGESVQGASDVVNKFLFDYGDLTDTEKKYFKRAIPFYTFMRKNVPLQLEQMLTNPKPFRILDKGISNFERLAGTNYVDEDDRNEWRKDYIQLPFQIKGENVGINLNLPYQQLDRLSPKKLLGQASPFIRIPSELAMGEYAYTGMPITSAKSYVASQFTPTRIQDVTENKNGLDKTLYPIGQISGVPMATIREKK